MWVTELLSTHDNDVIVSLTIVYSTVYSVTDQSKHQSPASLAFVRGIHRWPVNSPHKGPVMRKIFPFDDVIMQGLVQNIWYNQFIYYCICRCGLFGGNHFIMLHELYEYNLFILIKLSREKTWSFAMCGLQLKRWFHSNFQLSSVCNSIVIHSFQLDFISLSTDSGIVILWIKWQFRVNCIRKRNLHCLKVPLWTLPLVCDNQPV